MFSLSKFLMTILPVLIGVAFITLLERKILGLSQFRKGPNKPSMGGILQPAADAVKLFLKEMVLIGPSNKILFSLAPGAALLVMLLLVSNLPGNQSSGFLWSAVLVLVVLGLGVYPVFIAGWSSNSKYSLLGGIRGVAQTISYEIALALFLFTVFLFLGGFNLSQNFSSSGLNLLVGAPLLMLILISAVAETNRTPFDFAEGESELVSGFNTEYGGGMFALIFMAEYGMIIFFSYFLAKLSASSGLLMSQLLIFFWVWLRATFPRYRYDKLLNLAWKTLLPWAILILFLYFLGFLF